MIIEEVFMLQNEMNRRAEKLDSLLNQKVRITFTDGSTAEGILEWNRKHIGLDKPSGEYSVLKADGNLCFFRKSHVKRILKRSK